MEANVALVREKASLKENMAVIDGFFRVLVERGPSAVPCVPERLVVHPPAEGPA